MFEDQHWWLQVFLATWLNVWELTTSLAQKWSWQITSNSMLIFCNLDSFLLAGSISYISVFIRWKLLLFYLLLLAEHIFQTYNQPCVFAKEHHSLTSRHKLLLIRYQRAVSAQEGNARSAWLVAVARLVDRVAWCCQIWQILPKITVIQNICQFLAILFHSQKFAIF